MVPSSRSPGRSPRATTHFWQSISTGNGLIDSGVELFGNFSPGAHGQRAFNGFDALHHLDGDDSSDGRISPEDAYYGSVVLWFDRNHDGISESGELVSLADAGIREVYMSYTIDGRQDRYGNRYRYKGWTRRVNEGNAGVVSVKMYDVYLTTLP
jgi:hypothetical protein